MSAEEKRYRVTINYGNSSRGAEWEQGCTAVLHDITNRFVQFTNEEGQDTRVQYGVSDACWIVEEA